MRTPTNDDKLITPQGIVVFKCEEEQSSKKAEDQAFHFCPMYRQTPNGFPNALYTFIISRVFRVKQTLVRMEDKGTQRGQLVSREPARC